MIEGIRFAPEFDTEDKAVIAKLMASKWKGVLFWPMDEETTGLRTEKRARTIAELRKTAKERGIKISRTMSRKDLEELLYGDTVVTKVESQC